jgi:hypothetical protein
MIENLLMLLATLLGFCKFVGLGEYVAYATPDGHEYALELRSFEQFDVWYTCEVAVYQGSVPVKDMEVGYITVDTHTNPMRAEDELFPQISCLPNGGEPIISVISYTKTLVSAGNAWDISHAVYLPVMFNVNDDYPIIVDDSTQPIELTQPITSTLLITDTSIISTP